MTNEDFIRFCYEIVLNREVEPETLPHWERVLESSPDGRTKLFSFLLESEEGRARFGQNRFFELAREQRRARSFSAFEELSQTITSAQIVDIGAAPISVEADSYESLIEDERWHVVGFEPDESARAERQDRLGRHRWLPDVIGDGSPTSFFTNVGPLTSSTLAPNHDRIGDFEDLVEEMAGIEVETVPTTRLDDVAEVDRPAFVKIDVQGGEASVLAGASRVVAESLVVQLEVEFFPIYAGNPLFSDLDPVVRGRGFEFFAFDRLQRYLHRDNRADRRWLPTRMLWGDAVYVPEKARVCAMERERLAALCWVMHDVYRAYDYCLWALALHDARTGGSLADAYREFVTHDDSLGHP